MAAQPPAHSSRTRNRNNLLHLLYDTRFPNLKVTKKCRSNLAVMGVPGPKGDHFLWPEEAAFLMENCLALVMSNSRPLTQYEGYRILEEKKVSWAKYYTYSTLKKAGFVVVRPKRSRATQVAVKEEKVKEEDPAVPDEGMAVLLDCFPSLSTSDRLHMPQLHLCDHLVSVECSVAPHSSVLQTTSNSARRRACRPKHWPSFDHVVRCSSWSEYARRRKAAVGRKSTTRRHYSVASESPFQVDYEVYHPQVYSYNVETQPVFRLVCIDSRENNFSSLPVANYPSVVFSIFDGGKVNFVSSSGDSIDINHLLNV